MGERWSWLPGPRADSSRTIRRVVLATAVYVVASSAWIAVSDRLVFPSALAGSHRLPAHLAFVAVTALVLALVMLVERERARRALSDSQRSFKAIVETSPAGIFRTDAAGRTTYVNPRWCEITGFPAERAMGLGWQEAIHPDDRGRLTAGWEGATEAGRVSAAQYRFVRPDGGIVWVTGQAVPEIDDEGMLVGYVGTVSDITALKRAQQAVEASQAQLSRQAARLETAQRVAGMGFLDWDLATGNIFLSQHVRTMYGLDPDGEVTSPELVSRSVHPDDLEAVRLSLEAAASGERTHDLDHRIVRPDGTVLWVHAQGELMRDERGRPATLLGTVVDVTERKREQQALRESEERYRSIVEHAPFGIYQSTIEGRLLTANPALAAMLRFDSPADLVAAATDIGGRFFVDPGARNAIVAEALACGRFVQREVEYRRRDGSVLVANLQMRAVPDGSGRPVFLEGFTEDVTERRRASRRLDEQVRMLEALNAGAQGLVETLSVPMITERIARTCVERFGARLVWVGSAEPDGDVRVVSHFPSENEYPKQISVRWDDSPLGHGPTGGAIRSGLPVVLPDLAAGEFAPWRETARSHGLHTSAAFPLLRPGRAFGAFMVYSDQPGFFTEERLHLFQTFAHQAAAALENARLFGELQQEAAHLEQRVAERTAELEEKNRELDAFAYSVSHDLRAPLRAMFGLSQALLEDYGDRLDETGKEYAGRVVAAASRLDEMIQDLLTYSRLTRGEVVAQPVDLGRAVSDALLVLREQLADADVTVPERMPLVMAHRPTLLQVLTNLIGNAAKFVAPGARPAICIAIEPRADEVRVTVADNGIGIAPEHLDRIFNVFERLHATETYPGTGIGLAIVRKGVERMGGRVAVESRVGGGSRFSFELPLAGGAR